MGYRYIPPKKLEPFAHTLVEAYGADEKVAAEVAASLVGADLRGHHSHGVIRLPMLYRRMSDDGSIDPKATVEVVPSDGATAAINGNHQFGQVVGRVAVNTAVELAANHGTAAVGIQNATHLGRIGEWAERAAERGFLFAAFINTGGLAPHVAPPGSADRRLATNPVAFGIPSFDALEFPLVLDMATSQVAHGKITKRAVESESLPEKWVVAASGKSVTDAAAFEGGKGAILPLGGLTSGYKGFGLAVITELFAGMIGDAFVAGQDAEGIVSNAATFVTVDPGRFSTPEANRARIKALATHLRSADYSETIPAGPAARGDTGLLPGEAEYHTRIEREADGIPFTQETFDLLADLAVEYDVTDAIPNLFEA